MVDLTVLIKLLGSMTFVSADVGDGLRASCMQELWGHTESICQLRLHSALVDLPPVFWAQSFSSTVQWHQ